MNKPSILVIGLTGNIGSGKSEVAKIFEQLGAKVYSADTMAKSLMLSSPSIRKGIISSFGKESYLPDGTLNRPHIAKQAFSDSEQLQVLNSIVHPEVIQEMQAIIDAEEESKEHDLIIIEAALIFEAGIDLMFDYVITVKADEATCIERIKKRDNLSLAEITKRMSSQIDSKKKEADSDFVINNNSTLDVLKDRCKFLYMILKTLEREEQQ